jgi:hypothetical protein
MGINQKKIQENLKSDIFKLIFAVTPLRDMVR